MLGQRVSVRDEPGVVRFIGDTQFAPGTWYGVELDRAAGKNDGSVNGIRYFDCTKEGMVGVFVRQALVKPAKLANSTGSRSTSRPSSQSSDIKDLTTSTARPGTSPGPDSSDPSPSTLHKIIEKLQSKLQTTTNEIKKYKETVQYHKDRMSELEGQVEMVSIDKDFLASSKDELSAKLKELQLKYDELKTDYQIMHEETELNKQIENEIKSQFESSGTNKDVQIILLRNKQLELALLNLQKLSEQSELTLQQEINSLKQELQGKLEMERNIISINNKLRLAEETILSLQIQLDSALSLEKIIEHLNLENERLIERVNYLQKSVDELTELHELDRSLEENQTLVETELRNDLKNLLEVIRKDQALIKELEKKNTYLSSKLKNSSTDPSIEESNTSTSERSDLLKEIEAYQLQIKSLKTTSFSDSISSKIAQSRVKLFQERLEWTDLRDDHPLKKASQVLYMIKSNISNCYVLEEVMVMLEKNQIDESYKACLLHSTKTLRLFLELLLHIWEYQYENNADEMLTILEESDMAITSKISMIRELNTEGDTDLIGNTITSVSALVRFNFGISSHGKFVYEFVLNFIVITDEISGNLIPRARQKLDEVEEGMELRELLSELNHSIVKFSSKSRDILSAISVKNGTLQLKDPNFNVTEFVKIGTRLIEDLSTILEGLAVDKLNQYSTVQEVIPEFTRIASNIISVDYQLSELPSAVLIYDALKSKPELKIPDKDDSFQEFQEVKTKYAEVTQSLLEKDRMLDEFQLNIQMLEGNMKSLNQTHSEQLNRIKLDLKVAQRDHQESKKKAEELMLKNLDLEAEIQGLVKSNRILENGDLLGAFDNLESEQQASQKLEMIEEIVLLRRMVQQFFHKQATQDNYSWLENPLIENKKAQSHSDIVRISRTLRGLALNSKPVKITPTNEWVPRTSRQRFLALGIWENALNYSCERNELLQNF
ncbi:uncharacterized protein CANTADRAFT_5641 [Suhomyces tanzawaensis NRRL Y-17324]|uniref:CAP-Gly domain-containing protein n=1 Tax=Suhomyces tanzawaensis NRRL Y-17324 TaxID=984487 RepID=A0A1E4SKC4_9ASCO|nr:uncharacterized protein CANTADRAFT_5641 [Suhomyces tanzawaensis NRRL Y-17324]ODV79959.1 hypothetical protein CANTADRAFT_5641 [Suhomyces tanzawaensis NRRL Y-17324]